MKIYTSYFSNSKKLAENDIEVIGIALFPPKWFQGASLKMVAPTYSILKYSEDEIVYTARYKKEVLERLDAKRFIDILDSYSKGKDVALCCFEKPNEFCHRHILSSWLNEKLGLYIQEFLAPGEEQKPPEAMQLGLF